MRRGAFYGVQRNLWGWGARKVLSRSGGVQPTGCKLTGARRVLVRWGATSRVQPMGGGEKSPRLARRDIAHTPWERRGKAKAHLTFLPRGGLAALPSWGGAADGNSPAEGSAGSVNLQPVWAFNFLVLECPCVRPPQVGPRVPANFLNDQVFLFLYDIF